MDGCGDPGGRIRSSAGREITHSANLRDLIRLMDDDRTGTGGPCRLTMSDVLSAGRRPQRVQSNRTLLDVIRDDAVGQDDDRVSWRQLTDKLRLHRSAAAAGVLSRQGDNRLVTENHPTELGSVSENNSSVVQSAPASSQPNNVGNRPMEPNPLPSNGANEVIESTGTESREPNQSAESEPGSADRNRRRSGGELEEQPVRMSLMALLAEAEGPMYGGGEEEDVGGGGKGKRLCGGEQNCCCVCMVRHKGAAFIPCGHTFCRLCSRELWVRRGNCPLCNGFILEVLDIF